MATGVLPSVLVALGLVAAAFIVILFLSRNPRSAFAAWTLTLFFVPVWVGVTAGFFWSGVTLATLLVLIINAREMSLHIADGWMVTFIILLVGLFALGEVDLGSIVAAVLEWVIPYVWGRVVLSRVSVSWVISVISVVAVVAACLALVESLLRMNFFVGIPGSATLREAWTPLQFRAGLLRAEGAFGHSIALGAVLAMSSAFIVATRWRLPLKLGALIIVSLATVLTFSRAGLITLVVTLALAIALLPAVSTALRWTVFGLGAAGAGLVLPFLSDVFFDAGQEAGGSADYRTDLLVLVQQAHLFGNPGDWSTLVSGDYYLGFFARSIDNAVVLALLRYGYVPTFVFLAVIVCAVWTMVRSKARGPAAIAVAGQLPGLVVVAMITQYGMFFWFCVGLAIASAQKSESRAGDGMLGASPMTESNALDYRIALRGYRGG